MIILKIVIGIFAMLILEADVMALLDYKAKGETMGVVVAVLLFIVIFILSAFFISTIGG